MQGRRGKKRCGKCVRGRAFALAACLCLRTCPCRILLLTLFSVNPCRFSPLPTANIHTSPTRPFHTSPTLQTEQGYRLAHLGEGKEAVSSYDSPLTVYEEVSPGNLKYDLEDAKLLQVWTKSVGCVGMRTSALATSL